MKRLSPILIVSIVFAIAAAIGNVSTSHAQEYVVGEELTTRVAALEESNAELQASVADLEFTVSELQDQVLALQNPPSP